jgi:2-octaprenyl-6-methoxyphenol hydroxylase
MTDYDVIIAGGGMVGASLVHALAGGGLRVAVVEAVPPAAASQPSYDDRAIALAYGTRRILEALGVWSAVAPHAEPIRRVHVSDRGHFGFTHLDAADEGAAALGYVVTARDLGAALLAPLAPRADLSGFASFNPTCESGGDSGSGNRATPTDHRSDRAEGETRQAAGDVGLTADLLCPARVADFGVEADRVRVSIEPVGATAARSLAARLLVAADGGRSTLRERLGIAQRHHVYGHHAVVANVTPSLPHEGVAYERFTESGPLALLPMTGNRCGLVWTARDGDLADVLALDDRGFLAALQERFGFRLGRFTAVGRRSHYPLELRLADTQVLERVAIIGNAAHTVHPIAGQGFNLGIRDVAMLADVLIDANRRGRDIGALAVLDGYGAARWRDQRTVALATDVLARLFVNPLGPVRMARNIGMTLLDAMPPAKHLLAQVGMGLAGRQPRLARGLPLAGHG